MRQLIFADRILINKIDLIPESERPQTVTFVRESIAKVNQSAQVVETAYSKVDLDALIAPVDRTASSQAKTISP